jgi:DNA-binding beta-propeller fold protein YncE
LPGFHEPQGIAIVPDFNAVAIANGNTGTLQLIDRDTYQTKHLVIVGGDADNVRYDATAKQVYVAYEGGLAIVDPATGTIVQRLSIPGHPESFQLERNGSLLLANLPGAGQVVVADRQSNSVVARWPAGVCRANYPMALDESNHRVFIGCRQPASIAAYDSNAGTMIATTSSVGDTDDMFYDSSRKQLYVIGGAGYVDVLQSDPARPLKTIAHVLTSSGARTGLFVSDQSRLYVAVPHRANQPAEVRIYDIQN